MKPEELGKCQTDKRGRPMVRNSGIGSHLWQAIVGHDQNGAWLITHPDGARANFTSWPDLTPVLAASVERVLLAVQVQRNCGGEISVRCMLPCAAEFHEKATYWGLQDDDHLICGRAVFDIDFTTCMAIRVLDTRRLAEEIHEAISGVRSAAGCRKVIEHHLDAANQEPTRTTTRVDDERNIKALIAAGEAMADALDAAKFEEKRFVLIHKWNTARAHLSEGGKS